MKDDFKYFKLSDFDCQETGENEMNEGFYTQTRPLAGGVWLSVLCD